MYNRGIISLFTTHVDISVFARQLHSSVRENNTTILHAVTSAVRKISYPGVMKQLYFLASELQVAYQYCIAFVSLNSCNEFCDSKNIPASCYVSLRNTLFFCQHKSVVCVITSQLTSLNLQRASSHDNSTFLCVQNCKICLCQVASSLE